MENKILKAALIGCGVIAPNHVAAINETEGVSLVAICDVKPERANALANRFELDVKIYTDYKEMLDCEELDSVHIATPHYLHAEMAIYALSKGLNVYLEKPMCINRDEIDKLLEAEKNSKGIVCVSFQNRVIASTRKAIELIEADGGANSLCASVFWQRGEKYYTESGWRGSMKTEGGGVMINQAIHTLDMICEIMGRPIAITATKANHHLKGIIDVEDTCEGIIEFESGKSASFYATTSYTGRDLVSIIAETKNHTFELRPPKLYMDGDLIETGDYKSFIGKECYGIGHFELIRMYYDAIRSGAPSPLPLESAQYAVRILLSAYESEDKKIKV